jgi:alkylhydroperoxidase family enzyme
MAASLPQTTAVMLEQDFAFRSSTAFDPKLRAKMRWVAAHANHCDYTRAYAEADLKRAGGTEAEINALKQGASGETPQEQAALDFARKMTLAAYTVTDQEVAELSKDFFEEKTVVAMVLQMAFANFQDRLLLALKLPVEPDGPLPPLDVRFVQPKPGETIPQAARSLQEETLKEVVSTVKDSEWLSFNFQQLQQQLEQQRAREPRIRIPAWSDVYPLLPPALFPPDRPTRIKWSLTILGNQPQLAVLWLKGLRTFGREANQNRVFEETLFWVVTRSLQCFY